ncbi:MAG: hypothetical protein ACLGIJ_11785 [Candidatus Limnocylindria bacterium]
MDVHEPSGAVPDDAVAGDAVRPAALALARLHLRTGALALARTELETMAGRDLLDDRGILDLAEVRWRTGDVDGAGAAIAALLEAAPDATEPGGVLDVPVAWVIAAEAAAARGRPTEARGHADRLRARRDEVDGVFAGQLRSSVWPPDPLAPAPTSGTLFPGGTDEPAATASLLAAEHGGADPTVGGGTAKGPSAAPEPAGMSGLWDTEPAEIDPELAAVAEAIAATEPDVQVVAGGLDEAHSVEGDADAEVVEDAGAVDLPSPDAVLASGLAALRAGRRADAALQLALALRLAPALAPAVLDALGEDDDPGLALLRGDAYRLVGHEREARRAYARAWPPTETEGPSSAPDVQDARGADPTGDDDGPADLDRTS